MKPLFALVGFLAGSLVGSAAPPVACVDELWTDIPSHLACVGGARLLVSSHVVACKCGKTEEDNQVVNR